jgi:hypothetical protein
VATLVVDDVAWDVIPGVAVPADHEVASFDEVYG